MLSLSLIGWLAASFFFVVLGILTPMNMRPYLVMSPGIAMLMGMGAVWMWGRNLVGKAAAAALMSWAIWIAIQSRAIWVM